MSETAQLASAIDLLGRLLLREIDGPMLVRLREDPVRASLTALDLVPPDDAELDDLAAEYCAAFIGPVDHVPLIQSVYLADGLESASANAVREIARAAHLELDEERTRGAPVDHLGVILCLWAALAERWPEGAEHLARGHLAWARAPLAQLARRDGFYGRLAAATDTAIGVVISAARRR